MEKIKILSLFDGISGCRQALKEIDIDCDYYSSEIDKYAIQIAQANHPDIKQIGDVNGLKVDAGNKITFSDNPGDGTWYYALTTEEHSGLESDELSEILQVTVSGASIVSQSVVQPKGQKNYWTTKPSAPVNFNYVQQPTAGHYRLTWNEPADNMIRYYNIYYSNIKLLMEWSHIQ